MIIVNGKAASKKKPESVKKTKKVESSSEKISEEQKE